MEYLTMGSVSDEQYEYIAEIEIVERSMLKAPYPSAYDSRFQYVIPQDKSVIVRDADTREVVLIVLRDVFPDAAVRQRIMEACREVVDYRQDGRCDVKYLQHTRERDAAVNGRAQETAGVVWNAVRSRLPRGIVPGHSDVVKKYDLPPSIDVGCGDGTLGAFRMNGENVAFCIEDGGVELLPPSTLSAVRYAQTCQQGPGADGWIATYTTYAPAEFFQGGTFSLGQYGIVVLPSVNAVTAWHPRHYHSPMGPMVYRPLVRNTRPAVPYEPREDHKRKPLDTDDAAVGPSPPPKKVRMPESEEPAQEPSGGTMLHRHERPARSIRRKKDQSVR
ncbi:hypothetical protein Hte_007623 [Hypoxylon texense]